MADHACGTVDGEVDARLQDRGGDHRHHGDEGLHHHAAVSDQARVTLALEHFGRGARGNQ